jgi:hypothetical protein
MEGSTARSVRNLLPCAAIATTVLGCAADVPPEDKTEVTSQAAICNVQSSGDPWWIATFPEQSGRFHVLVRATPLDDNIDAVIGLSKGAASTWSQLAAIVRFNPNGVLDVRRGSEYAAITTYPYTANTTYFFRIDVDVTSRTYSVYVKNTANGNYTTLAYGYAFRTEQATVTSLDAAGVYLDTTAQGSLQICDLEAIHDDTEPDGCVTATAGQGFANAWMEPETGAMIAQFGVTPSANAIDAVVGYSAGPADSFSDLAAAVRFYTNGQIEARDGDVYRSTNPMSYVGGRSYMFHVVLDFASQRYSVYAGDPQDYESYTLIAKDFQFRPQQAGITLVNNVAAVVDSSTGSARACGMTVTSEGSLLRLRTGPYRLAPFRDGRILLADGTTGHVVDNTGRTVASGPLESQWQLAVDASGNIYTATVDPPATTLTLTSVTETFAPRWSRTYAIPGAVVELGVYDSGEIGVALGASGVGVGSILTLDANGNVLARSDLPADVYSVGFGRDRYALGSANADQVSVEVRAIDGTPFWQRTWSGVAWPYEIVVEPSGSVVFGGTFGGTGIDFGAGHFEPYAHPETNINGYIVALSETGGFRFANRLFADAPTSIASSGDIIAYATTMWTQMPHTKLFVYGRDGTVYHTDDLHLTSESHGSMGETIVDSEGRVIANASLKLHPSNAVPWWPIVGTFVF